MNEIATTDDLLLLLGLSGDEINSEYMQVAVHAIRVAETSVRNFLRYDPTQASRTEYYPTIAAFSTGYGVYEVNDTQAYIREVVSASTEQLQVRHIPIRSVTSLRVDYDGRFGTRSGSFGASTAWTEGSDFWPQYDMVDSDGNGVCSDGILRSEGRWPDEPGAVKIVYSAGYTSAELKGTDSVIDASSIYDVVIDEARRRFIQAYNLRKTKAGFTGPFTSESLGDYSYSVDTTIRTKLIQGDANLLAESMDRLQKFVNYGWMMAG